VCVEAEDAQEALRAIGLLGEQELVPWVLLGKNDAYRWLDRLAKTTAPLIVSLNFPPAPRFDDAGERAGVETQALRDWYLAPEDPGRLAGAKVRFAFTGHGLKERGDFHDRVRRAVERGLSAERALAAVTTGPAAILGVPQLGVIAPGAIANLTLTDGEPFAKETKVAEVWVDGVRYPGDLTPPGPKDLAGEWRLELTGAGVVALELEHEAGAVRASVRQDGESVPLSSFVRRRHGLELTLPAEALPGLRGPVVVRGTVSGRLLRGSWEGSGAPGGELGVAYGGEVLGRRTAAAKEEDDDGAGDSGPAATPLDLGAAPAWPPAPEPAPPAVLVQGARIWTQGPRGVLEGADLLCVGGEITAVGYDLEAPPGAVVVDGRGKHLTPGLIDCHSHSFVVGRVNESSNTCTAEVRIGDVLDAQTVRIYQQLAGGLTTANVLHGSANAIGGQNAVVQLRWGEAARDLVFEGAKPGIKWALGENPKRSNWGRDRPPRYPASRLGVQEAIRERLLAARSYQRELAAWRGTPRADRIPPRIDLQLEALVEVLEGERLVHCHSYRQDEILALLRLAEEFGFTVGTFQHVLEGYKVAEELAAHGAGASTFSDWWAYKFEVYDAIPHNGALMHRRGVVVSFNSDSSELARRLNQEAAKAVRHGGLEPAEALDFVTRNPARQLGVDGRVGSLQVGKQGDFVLWSAHPLGVQAKCEQTWIAGRRYYERTRDQAAYALSLLERAGLLAAAQAARHGEDAIAADGWRPTVPFDGAHAESACCQGGGR
jgi:imidazolonepropionase-like amidohydrolase